MPTTDEFAEALRNQLQRAQAVGAKFLDINAGQLHRKLGGYPNDAGKHHQMPSCCSAMYAEKRSGDTIVAAPPKGKGASLTIRYKLPR